MKFLILVVLLPIVFSCAEENIVPLEDKLFFSIDSVSSSANPSVFEGDSLQNKKVYNNSIVHSNIKDSSRTVLTSSLKDIEAVMGYNGKIGFFQSDTQAMFFHYSGNFFSSFVSNSSRDIVLKARHSTNINMSDSTAVIIIDNDTSLAVYPVNAALNIAGTEVYPGSKVYLFGDAKMEKKTVTANEADFFVNWLTISRVYPLVSAVRERESFPILENFIEEVFVNTAVQHKLNVKTRRIEDSLSVVSVNIPRGATFRGDTLFWRPTAIGTAVFRFKLVAGLDTVSIYRKVRVIGALNPAVNVYSQRGTDNNFEVVFDFSRARSSLTGDRALSFRIESDDITTNWFTERQKRFSVRERGRKNFTIRFKTATGEQAVVNRSLTLEDPPEISVKVSPTYISQGDTVRVDLSGTKDDRTPSDKIRVSAEFVHNDKVVKTLHGNANSVFTPVLEKSGEWYIILNAHDLGGNRSQKRVAVNVGKTVRAQIQEVHRGVVNRYMVIPINITGDNVDSIFIDFTADGTFDQRGAGNSFRAQAIYSEDGEHNVAVKVTTKGGKHYLFSTKAIVESSPTILEIKPPTGEFFVNQGLNFAIKAENPHRVINTVKCDFDGNKTWDFQTQNERDAVFAYRRSGRYTVRCKAIADNGQSVYDSIVVDIRNTPPKIGRLRDITPRVRERVTIRGTATDPDAKKLEYAWDTDGDGTFDILDSSFSKRFEKYTTVVLRVMDDDSAFVYDTMNVIICPADMVLVDDGPYCIDKYEFPNERHVVPTSNITYPQAVELCKSRGKRVCTETEWLTACRGRRALNYPYGNRFEANNCNVAGNRNRAVESGNFFRCESTHGAIDMSGNLSEWVSSSTGGARAFGGSFLTEKFNSACNSFIELDKNSKYFHTGVRCCK